MIQNWSWEKYYFSEFPVHGCPYRIGLCRAAGIKLFTFIVNLIGTFLRLSITKSYGITNRSICLLYSLYLVAYICFCMCVNFVSSVIQSKSCSCQRLQTQHGPCQSYFFFAFLKQSIIHIILDHKPCDVESTFQHCGRLCKQNDEHDAQQWLSQI